MSTLETQLIAPLVEIIKRTEPDGHQRDMRWGDQREPLHALATELLRFIKEQSLIQAPSKEITTPCPGCGRKTLFIGSGGHLTCGSMQCKNPSPEDVADQLWSEVKELRLRGAVAKVFMESNGVYGAWLKCLDFFGLPTEFKPRA